MVKLTDGITTNAVVEELTNGVVGIELRSESVESEVQNGKAETGDENNGKQQQNLSDQENHRPETALPRKERGKRRNQKVLDITLPAYVPGQAARSQGDDRGKARRKPRVDAENVEPTEKLFVGGIPLSVGNDELRDYFSQFGNITEALTKDSRGFGFVTFASIEEANAALDVKDHKLGEREIEVKRAIANGRPHMSNPAIVTPMSGPVFYPSIVFPTMMPIDPNLVIERSGSLTSCSSSPSGSHLHMQDYETDGQQQKKLFIGGLHWRTEDDDLRNYFSTFGLLTDAMVIKCPEKHKSRGFGFVVFGNPEDAEAVLRHRVHSINEKIVDVKRAVSRDLIGKWKSDSYSENNSNNLLKNKKGQDVIDELGRNRPVDKVFVGGIAPETTRKEVRDYFEEKFEGCKVKAMDMKVDEDTGSHQRYAFITFDTTDACKAVDVVEAICQSKYQRIGSHLVEVKKAHSKNARFIKNAERKHRERDYHPPPQVFSPDYPGYQMYPAMYQMYPYPLSSIAPQVGAPSHDGSGHYDPNNGVWYPNQPVEEEVDVEVDEGEEQNNNGAYPHPPPDYNPYAFQGYYPSCATFVPSQSYPYGGQAYISPQHVNEH